MRYGIYSILGVFALILALFLAGESVMQRPHSMLRDAFAPFMAARTGMRALMDVRSRQSDVQVLSAQLAAQSGEIRQLRQLDRENRELRAMLGLTQRSPHSLLAAQVASRNLNTWWQQARLDRGADRGVTGDLPVMTVEGLVGRVVSVSRRTADVLFLIDPACRVAAVIPRVNAFGIVQGQGGRLRETAFCRMDFISREMEIVPGDEVLTSGLGGIFPAGLLIGYVRQVEIDSTGLYQSAEILPAVDFRNLRLVFIVMDQAE